MLVIIGESCSGKDTVLKELKNLGMKSIVTYTTRPPREGEVDGVDYHFVSEEEFEEMTPYFGESASYDTAYGVWKYGSRLRDYDGDKVIILNPEGMKQIIRFMDFDIVVCYITTDIVTRIKRAAQRGDTIKEFSRRLEKDELDFANVSPFAEIVINNDGKFTAKEIAERIITQYKRILRIRQFDYLDSLWSEMKE